MFQEINTGETGHASTAFKIKNETFIVFASHYNYLDLRYAAHSTVFKWSGNSFVKLQSLHTYGALDVKSFNINSDTFLAFPTSAMEANTTLTRSSTSGMAASSFSFSLSPLVELTPGIHL